MVRKADLLSLQLGHWTFVLGSAEQTNVCVLTHWNQKTESEAQTGSSRFSSSHGGKYNQHQSLNDGAVHITPQCGTRQLHTTAPNIILTSFLIMKLILIRTSDLKRINVRRVMTGRTEVGQTRDLDSLDCFGGVVGDVDVDADGLSMVIELLRCIMGNRRTEISVEFRTEDVLLQ